MIVEYFKIICYAYFVGFILMLLNRTRTIIILLDVKSQHSHITNVQVRWILCDSRSACWITGALGTHGVK